MLTCAPPAYMVCFHLCLPATITAFICKSLPTLLLLVHMNVLCFDTISIVNNHCPLCSQVFI